MGSFQYHKFCGGHFLQKSPHGLALLILFFITVILFISYLVLPCFTDAKVPINRANIDTVAFLRLIPPLHRSTSHTVGVHCTVSQ